MDDDLDPVEVRSSIEASFEIRLTVEESASCRTVGDIFDILRDRFSDSPDTRHGRATAMAFYRLRNAFKSIGTVARLQPDTQISAVTTMANRTLLKRLRFHSGLRLPRRRAGLCGVLGAWGIAVGAVAVLATALLAPHLRSAALPLIGLGAILVLVDPGRLPTDCATLGGLSKKVSGLNFGRLSSVGAAPREKDLWNALVDVLSEHVVLPKAEICPETFLLQKELRLA